MKQHLIYKITNTLNGRFYVGMHTGFEDDNYFGSGRRIKAEIKKYGRENFKKEILEVCSDRKSLKQREAAIVNEELLIDPLCLNLKNGGEGGGKFKSKEHQQKCTIAAIGTGTATLRKRLQDSAYEKQFKQNVSNSMKAYYAANPQMKSINQAKATAASKSVAVSEKRKETFAKIKFQQGENNSQFGVKRIGIIKDGKIKKVLLDQVQLFLDDGWKRGFK